MLFTDDKIDVLTHDLHDVALYFRYYDEEISDKILQLDDIVQSYMDGEYVLHTKEQDIDDLLAYLASKKEYLLSVGFDRYEGLFDFILEALSYKQDLFDLLGKNGEKNYIVVLQNTAEKRPNGGFFGSFGFITIRDGFLKNVEVIDSYYPNWIAPEIRVQAPEWSREFIPDGTIGFVSANKFGFTHIDGRNIKNLYNHIFNSEQVYSKKKDVIQPWLFQRTFNKKVDGVIFVRSDFLTYLLPSLQEKLWEWQFVNASVDLIRKTEILTWTKKDFSHKKAQYIAEVNEFFDEHKTTLAKNFIRKFDSILEEHYINVYLEQASTGLQLFLEKNNLTTPYRSDAIYVWDSNDSYNKVDTFVRKEVAIYDAMDRKVSSVESDIISVAELTPGDYTLRIKYQLSVPPAYIAYMRSLEEKYGITLTERELGILAMQPAVDFITGEKKYWATRATVYVPSHFELGEVVGDITDSYTFTPSFAKGVFYSSETIVNDSSNGVRIYFKVP